MLVFFRLYDFERAFTLSIAMLGLLILPVGAWILFKIANGQYANFDVSVRNQRASLYTLLISLLALAIVLALYYGQPKTLLLGLGCFFLMLVFSFVINSFLLKTSLHTGISFFFAFVLWRLDCSWGLLMFLMAFLVSGSRLVLKRHTLPEVLVGLGIGAASGLLLILGQQVL